MVKFTNNASDYLKSATSAGDTQIELINSSNFPELSSGDWSYFTIANDVVRVVGQDLESRVFECHPLSRGYPAGVRIEVRVTAEMLNDLANTAIQETEPVSAKEGTLWYDTQASALKVRRVGVWEHLVTGGALAEGRLSDDQYIDVMMNGGYF